MVGWLLSLLLTLVFALGAAVPGTIDSALERELAARLHTEQATVHVTGDPLLEIPFGRVRAVSARLEGARVFGPRLEEVTVRLEDLRLDPLALFGHRAVLTAPAAVALTVRLDPADVQAYLEAQEQAGALGGFKSPLPMLGGGTLELTAPHVAFEDGRVSFTGTLRARETGLGTPFAVSAALAIENGRRVVLRDERVAIRGLTLPSLFVSPFVAPYRTLLDLDHARLPAGAWRLTALDIRPDGLALTLTGRLAAGAIAAH